ncbi:unnamed protein product [Arabidopsis arenosa]|uniref:Protein kinase domain-containing protein n=1 Tax=Arabidopsis arenosa TaxID=38785 RepID=A0A8S2B0T6_ARAAE|nr:unnamed protein product [Arabidopsis arenosa]
MICHALLLFFILVSVTVVGEGATVAFVPTDVFLINCGDNSATNDQNGRTWTPEEVKALPSNSDFASFTSDALYQDSGIAQVPYMKARIFRSNFTYSFLVSPGWKFLRLYFYPTRYGSGFDAASSFFLVNVNGITLLRNFSADLTAKASLPESKSLIKEFIVPVHQTLNLTFTPSRDSFAFVNGIEIVSMPDRFYSKGGFDEMITNVGSNGEFVIENSTALETVHRLNVGGRTVNDVDDSGMFRRWLSDDDLDNSGIIVNIPGVKINYTEKTPGYVAPEDVYATSRQMGNLQDPKLNLNFNLTFFLTVDAGFNYLVRLHFCETIPQVNNTNQRVFSIFVGYQMANRYVDVILMSGGPRNPMYLDFNVYVGFENGLRPDLRLDFHPMMDDGASYYETLLNGVEILKLNDSQGNLAGPNPNPQLPTDSTPNRVRPPKKKGNKSHLLTISLAVVGSAIVLAMFVVVIVFVMKRKKKRNDFSVHTTSKPSTNSSWGPLLHVTGSTNTRSATSLPSDLCRRFSISEIKSATNDFEEKLIVGVGGFGSVYKGRIDGGATIVAVKRLEITSNQGAKEFETELEMLSKLRHVHLVSLIGYCDDDNEMVLCCRPIKMQSVPPEQADLIRWVKTNYKRGTVDQIIDSDLTDDITSTSMEKFCEIAVRCVLDRGIERPSMNDVVWALAFALQLHDTAKKKNDNVESLDVMPHGVVGTTTDGEDDLFSRATGHVEESTTTDDSVPVVGDERSGSSWGVFSEINEPKAR